MDNDHVSVRSLVGQLVESLPNWEKHASYYLGSLLPSIGKTTGALDGARASTVVFHESAAEKRSREARFLSAATQLRERLTAEEWASLAKLAHAYRTGSSIKVAADRRREDEFRQLLSHDFLAARSLWRQRPDEALLSEADLAELSARFVRDWAARELGVPLDLEQAAAVAAVGGDAQVVARAGAGKTRTLVTRALFLQKHCGVAPHEILLLAFNKSAAQVMRARLEEHLDDSAPHVMTFHALAYALVHPEGDLLFDESAAGSLGLSREVQRAIDDHLKHESSHAHVRELMLAHFRDDWEEIVDGELHLSVKELIEYRKALPRETLRGEYVKSFGEKLIANTLFENDVDYKYERNFRWSGVNYKPDFFVALDDGRELVIEYFGLSGDPDYDRMSDEKRKFWLQRPKSVFLEFAPNDIASAGADEFREVLLARLRDVGVTTRPLSDEEVWKRIQPRAIDRVTEAARPFVSRCRKRNLTPEALERMLANHTPITKAESLFLEVAAAVYSKYLLQLARTGQEDFDGLVWRAVDCLSNGEGRFVRDRGRQRGDVRQLRFVLVDEFQDFSEMFNALASGIRALSPSVDFFCVGDDWQAINGFAGSDLEYFNDFQRYFANTTRLDVRTNYRSPSDVVDVGNALMADRGAPAVASRSDAGWLRRAALSGFKPSPVEQERHDGDEATPALVRLVNHLLERAPRVVMLARTNGVPWYVNYGGDPRDQAGELERFTDHIRSFLAEEDRARLTASTTHKLKGLESPAVIILDADRYPLVHPDWVFLRAFGDSVARIEDEERRLFYVALTRSTHDLVILADSGERGSPFMKEIEQRMSIAAIDWSELPTPPSLDAAQLEIRVRGKKTYYHRERLRSSGFRWNPDSKFWWRLAPADGFDFEALCSESWAHSDLVITVVSENGEICAHRPAAGGAMP